MASNFEDYPELYPIVRETVRDWLPDMADPAAMVVATPRLRPEFGNFAVRVASEHPDQDWETLIAIDALHRVPDPARGLADNGRFYFLELTKCAKRPPFSATGVLWRAGLSVIDVDRPLISISEGTVELAVGVARWTPQKTAVTPSSAS